jgi:hypothetical protein
MRVRAEVGSVSAMHSSKEVSFGCQSFLASSVLPGSTEFYPLHACRGYLRDGTGHVTSREQLTLRTELPVYEVRDNLQQRNDWSDETYEYISWSVYR